jgi:hypothetical protein
MDLALQDTHAGDKFSNVVGPSLVSLIDNEYNNVFVCVFSFVKEVANAAKKHVPEALENLVLFFLIRCVCVRARVCVCARLFP